MQSGPDIAHDFNRAAVDCFAIALGGPAPGEHGVGMGKRKYMTAQHGASLAWMRRVRALFDPHGILNPGEIFPETG